ncbi:peptide chain release factor N(5)-glutamine methyltransferase [Legionella jordanis]|uniref:Release factor glutamine methyltransferase n=1 Tax=Legionella jordanis TaxID=456 RepID=A0A0W0V958_9GAMM|nr:peptide chain release factor N(5)-glutamine methyltransferase [Legionella jordanis]KTD16639.1 protein methyltransferase HemK [Legionella jordanis]RMX03826.1 peptide chain release factor N(5)-glutamine methyltransferase [Legionella jordanis]VEH11897.1 HemK protein [Legionella jordanis]HAT8712798.1 peptide chain release factor N(5)-glutamine methyltransferase [Legionella jordanis]
MRIKEALSQARKQLEEYSDSARLDSEVLLAHILQKNRSFLYAYSDSELSQAQWQTYQRFIHQRQQGMPVAYLTGIREFWSLPLKVSEDTLIPRPETELVVELTLALLADKTHAEILDLGTGSGAIALACAHERPKWHIIACDCSLAAIQVAEENASRLNLNNISFYHSNWFENIPAEPVFDAIVANPPYIAAHDPHLAQGDVRYEPKLALVSEEEGLYALKHIIKHSIARLKPGGLLLVEHGFDQKSAVTSMLKDYGYTQIQCWQDNQANDRVSGGKRE